MDDLTGGLASVTVLFALVLALSLLIERIIEVLKSLYDLADSSFDYYLFWTRCAKKIRDRAERKLRVFEYVEPEKAASALNRFSELLLNHEGGYTGTVPILSGDLVRALIVKVASKTVAICLGIVAASYLGLDLVVLWQGELPAADPPRLHTVLSGIVLGLGTPIVHKMITTIEKKQKKRAEGREKT